MMKTIHKNVVTMAVFAVSLLVLLFHVHDLPHPGQASFILMQKLGVDPISEFSNPVYRWVVSLISLVAGGSAIYGVNLFSAVCAAGVLAFLFQFVYRAARTYNLEKNFNPTEMHRIQLSAGLVSVLYLLASVPFCLAATRASPLPFDLLLLFASFHLVLSCTKDNSLSRLSLGALLYGIITVEFSTAILISPLFGVLVLYKLWTFNLFSTRNILMIFGAGLAGLLLYLIQAGLFMAQPVYDWRGFTSYFEVVRYIWVEQYHGLTLTLPRVGWLTLGLVSILPWLISSVFRVSGGSARARGAVIGTCALNAMLGVLAVLLLLDFPLAPVSLTGTGRLFVTPYVIIALWVGNVFAFWLVMMFREKRFENEVLRNIRKGFGVLILAAVPVYLLGMTVTRSLPQTHGPEDEAIQQFAAQVVDVAADKEWLITNTPIDDQISLEVYRRGLPIKVLRLSYARSVVYMKYVASLFQDDPRLESLASIGMAPLLDEWFLRMPDAERKVAVVHVPDLWLMAGMEAIPERVLFNGARLDAPRNIDALIKSNRDFWAGYGQRLLEVSATPGRSGGSIEWMRVHISKIANNLGVYLEDQGRPAEAFECYQKAREFAPDNLSALMNLHVLAGREQRPEYEALEEELKEKTEKLAGRVQTMALSYIYGFVRVPELFANRGMAFAMSGKANMAITDMKKALELKGDNPQVQMALAGMYFAQEKDVESRQYYEDVLKANPESPSALLGLMRVSMRQGELEQARELLARLKSMTNVDGELLKIEEAVLESFAGNPKLSMKLLREVVKAKPDNMKAWAALAITAAQLNDQKTGEEAMNKLRDAKALSPNIQLVMAQAAIDQNDRDGARRYLNDILRRQPNNIKAMELMLQIYLSEGNRDQVQRMVEQILNVDQNNALANYMLGVHHYYNEEYALAEASYRASLVTRRSPEALNDLAYVLYVQNKAEEAEVFIRESIALNDRNSAAWDTLGVILMKKGQLKDAEDALLKSLGLRPGAATVTLSLALLYEKQGRWDDVKRLADDVSARLNELPPGEQAVLRNLQQRLSDRI